jgi:hypothetical protein
MVLNCFRPAYYLSAGAISGFLLSNRSWRAGMQGKAFGKKIRSPTPARDSGQPKKWRGRFFLQNPQGPALTSSPAKQKFAIQTA